jgi:hypothetical protein
MEHLWPMQLKSLSTQYLRAADSAECRLWRA